MGFQLLLILIWDKEVEDREIEETGQTNIYPSYSDSACVTYISGKDSSLGTLTVSIL